MGADVAARAEAMSVLVVEMALFVREFAAEVGVEVPVAGSRSEQPRSGTMATLTDHGCS
jgi:hypothetical protein